MTRSTTKAGATIALLALLTLGTAACSAPSTTTGSTTQAVDEVKEAPAPVDLAGEWKQSNSNSPDAFQSATITGDTIEVYWNSPDTKSLFWAGTVGTPEGDKFAWDSVNDTEKTGGAMLASSEPTKTFTYDNGEITYEASALGTSMTIRLTRQ